MLSATLAIRADADRCDDSVGRRIDSRDARPTGIGDPDAPRARRRFRKAATRHGSSRVTLFVVGSMRETVFSSGWESQTAPSAGGGSLAGRNVDACDDGVSDRVDPQQRRRGVAHRPDRALTHGEGTALRRRRTAPAGPGCSRPAARPPGWNSTRVNVLDAKLLDPDGVPGGRDDEGRCGRSPMGQPGSAGPRSSPEREVDLGHRPSRRIGGEEVTPGRRQRLRACRRRSMGSPTGRSVLGSSRPTSAPSRSANHTFPAATATPTGKPPTWTRGRRTASPGRCAARLPASGSVAQT